MTREFRERKEDPYPDADPEDREALRFAKSWHRYPPLHEAVWYRGINLGEADEYYLIPEIVPALLERSQRRNP